MGNANGEVLARNDQQGGSRRVGWLPEEKEEGEFWREMKEGRYSFDF
jgi:hypothetical protein